MPTFQVYLVINAATAATPADADWNAVFAAAKQYPLSQAIIQAARAAQNHIQHHKRSRGVGHEMKNTIVDFTVAAEAVAGVKDVVNEQAALRGVTGGIAQKAIDVLELELQDGAIDAGYPMAQAQKLTIPVWWIDNTDTDAAAQGCRS